MPPPPRRGRRHAGRTRQRKPRGPASGRPAHPGREDAAAGAAGGRRTAPWFGLPDAATRRGALAAMALHVRGHDVHRWVAGQLADIAARGAGR